MNPASAAPKESAPHLGIVEWFLPGEYERVEQVLGDLRSLGVCDLRVGVSWAEWHASEGNGWLAWLLPRLAREVRIVPCLTYTPPSLGIVPKSSSPPDSQNLRGLHRRVHHAL